MTVFDEVERYKKYLTDKSHIRQTCTIGLLNWLSKPTQTPSMQLSAIGLNLDCCMAHGTVNGPKTKDLRQ
jgi:hypothetical protein